MIFSRPSTKTDSTGRSWSDPAGFTLLELLVAMSIFSLVVGMAMFSLRYSFGVLRHLDAPFAEETRRVTGLRDCLASTFIYVGERRDMFNRNKSFYTFFNGDSGAMTFVSTRPLVLTETALCRLSVRDRQLVLEESPLFGKDGNYLDPSFAAKESRETVILPDVSGFTLEYFQGDKRVTALKEELPTLVRISLVSDQKQQEFYCHVQSDFTDKVQQANALQQPL